MNESKILILLEQKGNAKLLEKLLEKKQFDIFFKDKIESENSNYDLIIADGVGYKRHEHIISDLKDNKSIFLPLLLVTNRNDVSYITSSLWKNVDDLIIAPIIKGELLARINVLLRARYQSQELQKLNRLLIDESKERLDITIKSGNIGLWDWNLKTNKVYYSIEWKNQIGYNDDEISDDLSEWESRVHPDDLEKTKTKIKNYIDSPNDLYVAEFRFQHKNGTYKWILAQASLLKDLDGDPYRLLGTHIEITEQKRREEELELEKEKAEESNKLKTAFLHNISHEIRTPMNGIMGFANLLMRSELDDESKDKYIEIIMKSGERMLNIISDLIDISKIETGQLVLEKELINVNSLLKELYDTYKLETESKGLDLKVNQPLSDSESQIIADKVRITQIISNLIKNSIKYSDKGLIEFGYSVKDKFLEFYVKDTGKGLSEDLQDKVFQRFVQEDTRIERDYEGAGLGLAISKELVEALGGKIWYKSEIGKGATFYFTIPYQTEYNENSSNKDHVFLNDKEENPHTILIVEDDETSALYLKELLEGKNFEIKYARNGLEAISEVKKSEKIKLILMDIRLPKLDGYSATREIKKIRNDLPVIAQTAYAHENDKAMALDVGCVDFITKPIDESVFFDVLKKYIQ